MFAIDQVDVQITHLQDNSPGSSYLLDVFRTILKQAESETNLESKG